jgi:hypothetical protein
MSIGKCDFAVYKTGVNIFEDLGRDAQLLEIGAREHAIHWFMCQIIDRDYATGRSIVVFCHRYTVTNVNFEMNYDIDIVQFSLRKYSVLAAVDLVALCFETIKRVV